MLSKLIQRLFRHNIETPAPLLIPKGATASVFTTNIERDEDEADAADRRRAKAERLRNMVFGDDPIKSIAVINTATAGAQAKSLSSYAADAANESGFNGIKAAYTLGSYGIPDAQAAWYGSQGFIGYQMCAILAQHWLIEKACMMPAKDAVRKGYKVSCNTGEGKATEILAFIEKEDRRFKLKQNLIEFAQFGRTFGIRIAMCKVRSIDPEYYVKPFNADGVLAGTYEGIVQIDPYWITPELTTDGAMNPMSVDFYEPTYWICYGQRIHKSHLIITRGAPVADVLKPSYLFGGVSIPQRIYERVYAAERSANEAPQLMLTKRSTIFYTDTTKALAQQAKFEERMAVWQQWLSNFGIKVADKEGDKIEQVDTALTDLDVNILTQYQLVCAAANVPATKMLGTAAKGLNATGEGDESNYHEELETVQTDVDPLIARHHLCVIRSTVAPKFSIPVFDVEHTWNPLDTPTAEELAQTNKTKAETDKILVEATALDGHDVRARLAKDPQSGYDGIELIDPLAPPADPEADDDGVAPAAAAVPAVPGAV